MSVQTVIPIGMAEYLAQHAATQEWQVALLAGKTTGANGPGLRVIGDIKADEVTGKGYERKVLSGARVEIREGRPCLNFDRVEWPGAELYTSGAVLFLPSTGHIGAVLAFGTTLAAVSGAVFVLPFDCPIRF